MLMIITGTSLTASAITGLLIPAGLGAELSLFPSVVPLSARAQVGAVGT